MFAGESTGSQVVLDRRLGEGEIKPVVPGFIGATLSDDGRIRLPGIPAGFSITSYLPLMHLYTSIHEASRLLDRYRHALRAQVMRGFQAPLTPLEPSRQMANLYYKREDLTATHAYKVRGAVVGMAKMMEDAGYRRFLAVSTGNHALGVLKAAELLRPRSVRLVVPENTASCKRDKIQKQVTRLQALGLEAALVEAGATFDEARAWAMAQDAGEYYLDPYSDPWVVAGQGTIGLELFHQVVPLLEQQPAVDSLVVVAPVGGGGLLAGTATALKMASAWDPRFRHVDVRFVGLPLKGLKTVLGDAIRVRQPASANRMLFSSLGVEFIPIEDTHMAQGIQFVQGDLGIQVEGASGATVYPACHLNSYAPSARQLVVSILSGANVTPHL